MPTLTAAFDRPASPVRPVPPGLPGLPPGVRVLEDGSGDEPCFVWRPPGPRPPVELRWRRIEKGRPPELAYDVALVRLDPATGRECALVAGRLSRARPKLPFEVRRPGDDLALVWGLLEWRPGVGALAGEFWISGFACRYEALRAAPWPL